MPGLEDLYREIILDHYRNPRNRGELETPPAAMAEGFNPLCGDEIKVYLLVDDGIVTDIKVSGVGCSVSQSSASMMSQAVKGKSLEQARAVIHAFKSMFAAHGDEHTGDGHDGDVHDHAADLVKLGDLQALQGVVKFPARIKCATLAWNTLTQALDDRA
jgi:nitrogen fixation protein NifU and related proteins